ncbi:MAG: LamG domain-containing protein [Opitutaceae bacterium]|jgi:hypothetical protein|nr:LamG domain-containing protein [Opitutaceae bacterium]
MKNQILNPDTNNTRTTIRMKHRHLRHLLCLPLCAAAFLTTASAQMLLLEYTFDDYTAGSTTTANTGALGSAADLTMYDTNHSTSNRVGTPAGLYSAADTGLGGAGRAFNGTGANGMGGSTTAYTGNRAQTTATISTGVIQSFTITGWFKPDGSVIGNGAKILDTTGSALVVSSSANGRLGLYVNGNTVSGNASNYYATGTWVFFAITYDGALTANNVNFYIGSESSNSLAKVGDALTLNKGSLTLTDVSLALGNSVGSNSRPFDGLIDNIRIYTNNTTDSGILTLGQIESLRATGSIVPEPATVTLLAGGAILGVALTLRRRARLS